MEPSTSSLPEQSPLDQPEQNLPDNKPRLGKIYAGLLFAGLISLIVFTAAQSNYQKRSAQILVPTPTGAPIKAYVPPPTPVVPSIQKTPVNGISSAIFYPFNSGKTINNPTPAIIGKIPQTSGIFLDTKFGPEISPVSGQEANFLRFIPGRTRNLTLKIDGVEIDDIFGIPQYPTLHCVTLTTNPDRTTSYDAETKQKTPPDIIHTTTADCLSAKGSDIPPLIFFAQVKAPLSTGVHTISIEGQNKEQILQTMSFTVDPNYRLPPQNIFSVDKDNNYQTSLLRTDTCMPSYYYDKNYLKFPVPAFGNSSLLYGISFPQTESEKGSINRRRVQIDFEGNRFDLLFPEYSVFYKQEISTSSKGEYLNPFHELFLPRNLLVFTDGRKADYWKSTDSYQITAYFEIYPVDLTGGQYRDASIPFNLSGSSGCDG